ncbi:MAG: hypothetical protein QXI83_01540 [Desulfurococcaceae archaeon]
MSLTIVQGLMKVNGQLQSVVLDDEYCFYFGFHISCINTECIVEWICRAEQFVLRIHVTEQRFRTELLRLHRLFDEIYSVLSGIRINKYIMARGLNQLS